MNMNTIGKGNLLSKLMVVMMVVMVLITTLPPTKASAHSAYFLSSTLNVGDARYEPIVLFDRDGFLKTHETHRESKIGYFNAFNYKNTQLPEMSSPSQEKVTEALKATDDGKYVEGGGGDPFLIYSFPGLHEDKRQANSQDLARAEWVSRTMAQSLNDAIGFVVQKAGKKPNQYELMYIGTNLANKAYKSPGGSFSYNGKTFKVTPSKAPANEKRMGVNSDGYVKITSGDETRYFVQKVPKGYKEKQPLYNTIPTDLKKEYKNDVDSLTWKHMVLQAHYSFESNGVTYDSFEEISKPNKVEQYFTEMGENFMLGLRSMLGLYSFSELMLNEGERGGNGYYFGIMPMSWMNSAAILHWLSMALSWMLMFLAFARVLAMRNLAAINIAKRVDLMEGIKSLIVVGFALMMFNPIFYALANFNFLLVDVLKNTSGVTEKFGDVSPGAGLLAEILISLVYLIVELYFNFIYIARGIVVAILYAVGPLFVASLAFGGKYSQMFSVYMKELVGNIYTQSFHALLVAFFASLSAFGGLRMFEQLVILFAFIPMTKFFREATGIGGGLMDVAGQGAFGSVAGLAQSGTKSFRNSRGKFASSSKASTPNGPGGGGGGTSASATSLKSSSSFTGVNAGKGGGTMATNDNSLGMKTNAGGAGAGTNASSLKKSSSITNASGANGGSGAGTGANAAGASSANAKNDTLKLSQSKASKDQNSMLDNDTAPGLSTKEKARNMAGTAMKVGGAGASMAFQPMAIAGAVGMAATGNGTVGQNLNAVSKQPQRKMSSTAPRMEPPKAQKAPSKPSENPSFVDSEKMQSHPQGFVKNRFEKVDGEGNNQLLDDYGLADVKMQGDKMAFTYDYNPNTKQFNNGKHATPEQAEMLDDMHTAFKAGDKNATKADRNNKAYQETRERYQKQGIQGVSYDKKTGFTILADKGTGGIQAVGLKDNHYSFHTKKGSNANVNLLDSINYGDKPSGKNKPPRR